MIGMVSSETERGDKIGQQTRYYLCSTKLDAENFAHGVRGHWGIENNRLFRFLVRASRDLWAFLLGEGRFPRH